MRIMKDEGYKSINIRRHGLFAFRRYKQWWYFEGLDPSHQIYYVFLALKGFPKSYISLKLIRAGGKLDPKNAAQLAHNAPIIKMVNDGQKIISRIFKQNQEKRLMY